MTIARCCQEVTSTRPSPFEVEGFGWYDGYTSGVARCRTCGHCYEFEMLSKSKRAPFLRVYGFVRIGIADYEALLKGSKATATDGSERNLVVISGDLTEEITAARVVDFPGWAQLVGVSVSDNDGKPPT